MTPLPAEIRIGIRAAVYQLRLEELTLSYRAADRALVGLHANAEQTVRQRFGLGPDEVFEYPEDIHEYQGPDFGEEVGEEEHIAEMARNLLRPAFVITLYHLWERHAGKWAGMPGKKFHHDTAVAVLIEGGAALDVEALKVVSLMANCAKHGSGPSGEQLFIRRPDLFRSGTRAETASADNLMISRTTLDECITILRRSTAHRVVEKALGP